MRTRPSGYSERNTLCPIRTPSPAGNQSSIKSMLSGSMYWVEGTDVVVAVVANVGTMHSGRVPGSAGSVARARAFIDQAMRVAEDE